MVNHFAIAVISHPARSRYIFPGLQDKCCPRGKTERCFHKAVLFFLCLHPRIQFFLPLWYLRFCSIVPFLSPRPPFDRFRALFSKMLPWIGICSRIYFLTAELISFYFLIAQHLRMLQVRQTAYENIHFKINCR